MGSLRHTDVVAAASGYRLYRSIRLQQRTLPRGIAIVNPILVVAGVSPERNVAKSALFRGVRIADRRRGRSRAAGFAPVTSAPGDDLSTAAFRQPPLAQSCWRTETAAKKTTSAITASQSHSAVSPRPSRCRSRSPLTCRTDPLPGGESIPFPLRFPGAGSHSESAVIRTRCDVVGASWVASLCRRLGRRDRADPLMRW